MTNAFVAAPVPAPAIAAAILLKFFGVASIAVKPCITAELTPPVTKPLNVVVAILLKSPPVNAAYVALPADAPKADAAIFPKSEVPNSSPA